jgi:crotonobetainyl-CoA:carnitine CoA-transferase CaiB-like acyl-CoA transferase
MWSRSNMGDTGNAMLAAIAITSALYRREITGEGQALSTSIVNAGLLATSYAWVYDDGRPADWGHVDASGHGLTPCYRMYRTLDDEWVFVAAITDGHRAAFESVLGATGEAALEAAFAGRPAHEWLATLDTAGVPAEIVDEDFCRTVFDDPVARADRLVVETWAPGVGRFEDPGLLLSFSETSGVVARGPCMCGEHTRELLRELGYADAEIDELAEARAVLDAPVERPA